MNLTVSVVFSGLSVVFGTLLLTRYKANKVVRLGFYGCLFGSEVSRIVRRKAEGLPASWFDVSAAVVFGAAALVVAVLLVRERRSVPSKNR